MKDTTNWAWADLKVSENFMNSALSYADSLRAAVGDLKAQGITGPQLAQAINAANKAQMAADKARNDVERARQLVKAQENSNTSIIGLYAALTKANESSFAAVEKGAEAADNLAGGLAGPKAWNVLDDHMLDTDKKWEETNKRIEKARALNAIAIGKKPGKKTDGKQPATAKSKAAAKPKAKKANKAKKSKKA
jgi:hypothetical protein